MDHSNSKNAFEQNHCDTPQTDLTVLSFRSFFRVLQKAEVDPKEGTLDNLVNWRKGVFGNRYFLFLFVVL